MAVTDACVVGSACVELIKTLPTALIALAVAIVSFRQYYLAKAKLKLDLFDKRMVVYSTLYDGFLRVPTLESGNHDELEWDAVEGALKDARFLFGQDIREYIEEMLTKWSVLGSVYRNKKAKNGEMSSEDREKERVLMHWFLNEASNGIHERFSKYLSFENWH